MKQTKPSLTPKNVFSWLALALLLFFALTFGVGALIHINATACNTGASSFWDVWRAQNFGAGAFDPSLWEKSYTVQPYRIQVVWDAPSLGAISTLEYLLFNCGWNEADLDTYFSSENLVNVIFADYQNVQPVSDCRAGQIRLYQFSAQFEGSDYRLWQWVIPDGNRRVFSLVLAFPGADSKEGLDYAQKLVSQLPQCP